MTKLKLPAQEITFNSLSWIFLLADIYGFKPGSDWLFATGLDTIFDYQRAHAWWMHCTIKRFSGFSPEARDCFSNALASFDQDGGSCVQASVRPHSRDSLSFAIGDLLLDRLVVSLPKLRSLSDQGPWRWDFQKGGTVLITQGEPDQVPAFTIPIPMPDEDAGIGFEREFTLAREVERLGLDPMEKSRFAPLNPVEMSFREWRDILVTAQGYYFRPVDSAWGRWQRYYRLRNPSQFHLFIDNGLVRRKFFDPVESESFARVLGLSQEDGLSIGETWYARDSDYSYAIAAGIKRVSMELIGKVLGIFSGGSFGWEVFRDGTVYVFQESGAPLRAIDTSL